MSNIILPLLPPSTELETKAVLKKCSQANRYLAELKGISYTIPNQNILINTLSIQEAKDSSAIENIITTHDDLFKEELFSEFMQNASAKEVHNYTVALKKGYGLVSHSGLLTNNTILEIQVELEKNKIEFIERDLGVTRKTAAKYLEELTSAGLLRKEKIGVSSFFVNEPLYEIFTQRRV